MTLGRPKGKTEHVKLDKREKEIRGYLSKGINKRAIAKLIDCAPSTLYDWLERKGIWQKESTKKALPSASANTASKDTQKNASEFKQLDVVEVCHD